VQNGTLVSFTTTIGRIEPSEARTHNGQVKVRFIAGGQSGQATITAFSGGASGRLENLLVGSAAAERVLVSATPQTLGPAGGSAEVSARVEDVSGAGLVGVPVTFSTSAGQLSASSAVTDESGTARTTLTTSRESTVVANVAGKTAEITIGLNPRTGVTLTGPTDSISAGLPASFTVGVGDSANVRDVTVDFGDGSRQSLGALSGSTTVQHTYNSPGTYTVTAIATEASGFTEQVATSVTILPGQPPGVIITPSNPPPTVNQIITLTATVSGATSTILEYQWDFGDGTSATTTGPQITKSYSAVGTKVIRVTVVQAVGPSGQGQTTVDVRQ
jgi:PKD repeat protein